MATTAGNIKRGEFIMHQGEIWQVQKAEFYSPGKGSALMKTKIKTLASGKNVDYTFKSNEGVETVDVGSIEMQYLYKDAESLYFMDDNYNQHTVPLDVVGDAADFLKEGDKYYVYMQDDKPLNIRPPMSVKLKIIETEEAVKGDTVTGAKKPAKLETGVTVMVPLFVRPGEVIVVNPESREYMERAKDV